MFKMRLEGLEEFVEFLGMMRERASKVQEAIEGGGDAKQVKAHVRTHTAGGHQQSACHQGGVQLSLATRLALGVGNLLQPPVRADDPTGS